MPCQVLDSSSHVLITGVTGLIGGEVLRELARSPVGKLSALIRPGRNQNADARFWNRMHRSGDTAAKYAGLVDVVSGDVLHPGWNLSTEDTHRITSSVDIIVHCAAETSFIRETNVIDTNITGTINLIELAKRCEKKPLIVYMSTATNVGTVKNCCVTEDEGCRPDNKHHNAYTHSKAVAETMLRESGLDVLVLRPTIVLSAGLADAVFARNILWFGPLLREFECLPFDPQSRLDIITSTYVAEATTELLKTKNRKHSCYYLSAGQRGCIKMAEAMAFADRFYNRPRLKIVPPSKWGKDEYRRYVRTVEQRKIFYGLRYYLPFFNMDVVYDNARLHQDLGSRTPYLDPMANYIDDLLGQISLDEAFAEAAKP